MMTVTTSPELPEKSGASILTDPRQWGNMLDLPCELTLDLPIPGFTLGDLLRIESGTLLETNWSNGHDIPVRINGQVAAFAEFEVVNNYIAARITEWA
jgi:flagellar motor switch/type III secretory pathway protein FliN